MCGPPINGWPAIGPAAPPALEDAPRRRTVSRDARPRRDGPQIVAARQERLTAGRLPCSSRCALDRRRVLARAGLNRLPPLEPAPPVIRYERTQPGRAGASRYQAAWRAFSGRRPSDSWRSPPRQSTAPATSTSTSPSMITAASPMSSSALHPAAGPLRLEHRDRVQREAGAAGDRHRRDRQHELPPLQPAPRSRRALPDPGCRAC